MLELSWAQGEAHGRSYAYTRPSPARYRWQWYWDSCFAAIVWRRLRPERSRLELESLLGAMRPDGFVGHVVFWERPVDWTRLAFYNVRSRRDFMTGTIQPPLLAWAWKIAVGDPAGEPRIRAHHEWLAANRDLEGDGLLWLIQPDESGLDAAPNFDPIWGLKAQGRLGFPLLVRRNARKGWDARAIAARGWPVACEVVTNVLWGLSRLAMGQPSITPALVDRLWDERSGLFLTGYRRGSDGAQEISRVSTWAALAPLALPDLPEEIGRRLVEEHLLDPGAYWTPVPPPSVATGESGFERRDPRGPFRRYWRGPTWVNSAWMLWIGLVRLGYRKEARRMTEALSATLIREGLREYYDPFDGHGLGATDFAWTTLALEMAAPDLEAAAGSYL